MVPFGGASRTCKPYMYIQEVEKEKDDEWRLGRDIVKQLVRRWFGTFGVALPLKLSGGVFEIHTPEVLNVRVNEN